MALSNSLIPMLYTAKPVHFKPGQRGNQRIHPFIKLALIVYLSELDMTIFLFITIQLIPEKRLSGYNTNCYINHHWGHGKPTVTSTAYSMCIIISKIEIKNPKKMSVSSPTLVHVIVSLLSEVSSMELRLLLLVFTIHVTIFCCKFHISMVISFLAFQHYICIANIYIDFTNCVAVF